MNDLYIRKATIYDIDSLVKLLFEVQNAHNQARPDLFIKGKKIYK